MDKLVRATAKNGSVRIIGAITTDLVNRAREIHKTSPTASSALGRMLTAGVLMGTTNKGDKDILTLKIDGKGPARGVTVTAHNDGTVKGYIVNPLVDLPLNEKGKLDIGGAIGKDGSLSVIRDMGLKEPYIGQVPIYTGEIGDDIAYYYTVSEQTPSAVGLGVLVDRDYSIRAAGGFIIQMMPDSDPLLADFITYRLEEIPSITQMIDDGKTIEEILEFIFEDMDLKIHDSLTPEYKCDCSREKMERALISIGQEELKNIAEDKKDEELKCLFCDSAHIFTPEDVNELILNISK